MPFPSPFPAPKPWQTGPGEEGAAPGAVAQLSSWPGTAVQSRIKREQNRLAPIPAVSHLIAVKVPIPQPHPRECTGYSTALAENFSEATKVHTVGTPILAQVLCKCYWEMCCMSPLSRARFHFKKCNQSGCFEEWHGAQQHIVPSSRRDAGASTCAAQRAQESCRVPQLHGHMDISECTAQRRL